MTKTRVRLVTPATEDRTVEAKAAPRRVKNAELRTREYLTADEVEKLTTAAKRNRYGHRDATMILVAYRHGLRAAELVSLEWEQVDFASGTLHVRRIKQGSPSVHPIRGDELRPAEAAARDASVTLRLRLGARLQAAGARLWYLPPYSPDLNPIEQAFAKIKHWMRIAQKRTIDETWRHIGHLGPEIQPQECANFFANAGYGSSSPTPAMVRSKPETL